MNSERRIGISTWSIHRQLWGARPYRKNFIASVKSLASELQCDTFEFFDLHQWLDLDKNTNPGQYEEYIAAMREMAQSANIRTLCLSSTLRLFPMPDAAISGDIEQAFLEKLADLVRQAEALRAESIRVDWGWATPNQATAQCAREILKVAKERAQGLNLVIENHPLVFQSDEFNWFVDAVENSENKILLDIGLCGHSEWQGILRKYSKLVHHIHLKPEIRSGQRQPRTYPQFGDEYWQTLTECQYNGYSILELEQRSSVFRDDLDALSDFYSQVKGHKLPPAPAPATSIDAFPRIDSYTTGISSQLPYIRTACNNLLRDNEDLELVDFVEKRIHSLRATGSHSGAPQSLPQKEICKKIYACEECRKRCLDFHANLRNLQEHAHDSSVCICPFGMTFRVFHLTAESAVPETYELKCGNLINGPFVQEHTEGVITSALVDLLPDEFAKALTQLPIESAADRLRIEENVKALQAFLSAIFRHEILKQDLRSFCFDWTQESHKVLNLLRGKEIPEDFTYSGIVEKMESLQSTAMSVLTSSPVVRRGLGTELITATEDVGVKVELGDLFHHLINSQWTFISSVLRNLVTALAMHCNSTITLTKVTLRRRRNDVFICIDVPFFATESIDDETGLHANFDQISKICFDQNLSWGYANTPTRLSVALELPMWPTVFVHREIWDIWSDGQLIDGINEDLKDAPIFMQTFETRAELEAGLSDHRTPSLVVSWDAIRRVDATGEANEIRSYLSHARNHHALTIIACWHQTLEDSTLKWDFADEKISCLDVAKICDQITQWRCKTILQLQSSLEPLPDTIELFTIKREKDLQ